MKYEPIKHSIDKVISKNPFLKKLFFRLLDIYLLRTWHVHKNIRQLKPNLPDNPSVLDAGAGFGQYSWFMLKTFSNPSVSCVDISQSHMDKARDFFQAVSANAKMEFTTSDLTSYNKPDSYDFILSVDVMEHIEDDLQVFMNFYESLKENGYLLVSTPSDQGGSDVHEHDEDESFIDEHVRDGYSIEDITTKLRKAGFTEIKANYTYGKPGKASWRLLMKYPITLLNTSKLFAILLPVYWLVVVPVCLVLNQMDVTREHETGTGLTVVARKTKDNS